VLRRIFNLAIMRGYVAQGNNPCIGIPMVKVGRKRPTYCSPPQFQSILTGVPDGLRRALLVVFYTTGLRLQEAMHLTWGDIDFAVGQLHVTRREAHGAVQRWEPKDHEMRTIPLPKQALDLLITWQAAAPENCPYVFMEAERWEYYRQRVLEKSWPAHGPLVNNVLRRFKTLCKRAGVGPFTIHDLRRSCITNWGGRLPIHVVQQLAGHSDIKTTQQFYLSVQDDDLIKAKTLQQEIVGDVPPPATDQKLTKSGRKRQFPGRKRFQSLLQEPEL
jgi:integrase